MPVQSAPNLIYALLLMIALLSPYVASFASGYAGKRGNEQGWLVPALVFVGAAFLATARGDLPLLALCLLLPLFRANLAGGLGRVAAVLLISSGIWWVTGMHLALVGAGALAVLISWFDAGAGLTRSAESLKRECLITGIIALLLGFVMGLATIPFAAANTTYTAWHHWGAYIAPAEAWLSGGAPYRDFPLQYGLGPTALLRAACGSDCWSAMYWLTVGANAFYFAVLSTCVSILTERLGRTLRWMALAALFAATFFWTGFPVDLATPIMTPSVGGLRFLPLAVVLLYALWADRFGLRRVWPGHLAWLTGFLWSPEVAFFVTLVWWPALAMRDAAEAEGRGGMLWALGKGALRGVLGVGVGAGILAVAVWALSSGGASATDFFIYVQNPPGPLPVNPRGAVWIALVVIGAALYALAHARFAAPAYPLYCCLLALLGACAYYLSRSHDNNVLNLFAWVILLSLAIAGAVEHVPSRPRCFLRSFVRATFAAMITFTVMFDWRSWDAGLQSGGSGVGPEPLVSRFTPMGSAEGALLLPNARNALLSLQRDGARSAVLIDERLLMPRFEVAGVGWTGVNNAANFNHLPDAIIQRYVDRGAAAYAREGWLVTGPAERTRWLAIYTKAYDVTEVRAFGGYAAYRLVPRSAHRERPAHRRRRFAEL